MTDPKAAWLEEVTALKQLQNDGDRTLAVDRQLADAVAKARTCGATWDEIGRAMGTTRQYANKRFGPIPR